MRVVLHRISLILFRALRTLHTVSFLFKFSGLKKLVKWKSCKIAVSKYSFFWLIHGQNEPIKINFEKRRPTWIFKTQNNNFYQPKPLLLKTYIFEKICFFNAEYLPFAEFCYWDFFSFKPSKTQRIHQYLFQIRIFAPNCLK